MRFKVSFIGSGNVAWNLSHALDKAGHTVIQIISRNEEHAKALAVKFGAFYGTEPGSLYSDPDIVFITLHDDTYTEIINTFSSKSNTIICHTSGALEMNIFAGIAASYGVFYPLQSLHKDLLKDFLNIPILIEGSDAIVEAKLFSLADDISNKVYHLNSAQRKKYHLAAVFANNFSNLMYILAEQFLEKEGLDFKLLHPIIYETAQRLKSGSAYELQTGPARRKDMQVIEKHLEMLSNSELHEFYEILTKKIMTLY